MSETQTTTATPAPATTTTAMQDFLRQQYPAQFYGFIYPSSAVLDFCLDVWTNTASDNRIYDMTALPSASDLIAMTAQEFALLKGSARVDVDVDKKALIYPARYYAGYDTSAAQPTQVTHWFDTWDMGSTASVPALGALVALTESHWDARMTGPQGVQSGSLVDYTPKPAPIPLEIQANNELQWVSGQASMASAMGETFTDEMKSYVKAVQAIANGTDTTSAALPQRPDNIMA